LSFGYFESVSSSSFCYRDWAAWLMATTNDVVTIVFQSGWEQKQFGGLLPCRQSLWLSAPFHLTPPLTNGQAWISQAAIEPTHAQPGGVPTSIATLPLASLIAASRASVEVDWNAFSTTSVNKIKLSDITLLNLSSSTPTHPCLAHCISRPDLPLLRPSSVVLGSGIPEHDAAPQVDPSVSSLPTIQQQRVQAAKQKESFLQAHETKKGMRYIKFVPLARYSVELTFPAGAMVPRALRNEQWFMGLRRISKFSGPAFVDGGIFWQTPLISVLLNGRAYDLPPSCNSFASHVS
jgi:hypothetical protein